MAKYSQQKIVTYFQQSDTASNSATKGKLLEDLVCYLFEKVPGIRVTKRNEMNAFATEEIDIAIWNDQHKKGFSFLPLIIIAECKNWSKSVGTQEVSYFIQKLQNKGLDHGILIATNGISGSANNHTNAYFEISMALSKGLRIIILTRNEIEQLSTTEDLVYLFKEKLCELYVN